MNDKMDKTLEREVERQIAIIAEGTLEIITENDLRAKLRRSIEQEEPLIAKLGADPTAPDIHLGHSVVLKKMRDLQDLGHTVVFLIGDFTALSAIPAADLKPGRVYPVTKSKPMPQPIGNNATKSSTRIKR